MKFILRRGSLEKAIVRSTSGWSGVHSHGFGRGKGSLRTVVRNGKAHFYFRYRASGKGVVDLPLGEYRSVDSQAHGEGVTLDIPTAMQKAYEASRDHLRAIKEGFDSLVEYRLIKLNRTKIRFEREDKTLRDLLVLYQNIKAEEGRDAKDIANLFKNYVLDTEYAEKLASEITPQDIASIIRPCRERTKRQWQKLRAYMQAAFNQALSADVDETIDQRFVGFGIQKLPFAKLNKKGVLSTSVRDRVLEESEIKALMNALDDGYKANLVRLFLLTGQRMIQLLRVPLSDFDEEKNS